MAAPSYDDLYQLGKAEMLLKRPDLFLSPGDVTDFLVAAAAAMADKCIEYAADEFRKTFIDGASGDDLTTLADDHWGIQRQVGNAAQTTAQFTRPSAGGGEPSGTLAAGFTISTEPDANGDRVEFTTDGPLSWAFEETGAKTVGVTAVVAGRAGNVASGALTNLVDAPFDATITVTSTAVAAGGTESETDAALRERVRAYPSTLRRGTLAALEYGAKQVASVAVATATEDAEGLVTVYVTDISGNSSLQMLSDVETELENWRAASTVLSVSGGALYSQDVDVSLTVRAGTDVAALTADIVSAIEARMERLAVGETLRREVIAAAAISVDPDNIIGCDVNTPAANVAPGSNELIRAGTVTVS